MLVARYDLRGSSSARRGTASFFLIVALPVFVFLMVMAWQAASLRHRQLELQVALDAAALAGVNALADDRLLAVEPNHVATVVANAESTAHRYAGLNSFLGGPLRIAANHDNAPAGEMVIGTLNTAHSRDFDVTMPTIAELTRPRGNALRLEVRRSGVAAHATAFADHDVIGFIITGTIALPGQTVPSIPVAPVAILTDPCPPALNRLASWQTKRPGSWEHDILARRGHDHYARDPHTGELLRQADGIPEITVTLSESGIDQGDNGQPLVIGVGSVDGFVRQLTTGVTHHDLQSRNGRLVLNEHNQLRLPRLALRGTDVNSLASALHEILGQRRVWPLYVHVLDAHAGPHVVLLGFVAARLMDVHVQVVSHDDGQKKLRVQLVLQPTMFVTATAVTDSHRRDVGLRSVYNPYLCRVRLVE